MENRNDSGFWVWFIDVATVVAAVMLYMKTSEVMTAIAPLTLLGQTGLQVLYGTVTAGLIEGVTLALHFVPGLRGNRNATVYMWFLFAVSGFCQFMDKQMVVDAGKSQSEVAAFFSWVALGIPLAVFGGLLWVANTSKSTANTSKSNWKGVVPTLHGFLYGSANTNQVANTFAEETETVGKVKKTPANTNGHKPEPINPTRGEK